MLRLAVLYMLGAFVAARTSRYRAIPTAEPCARGSGPVNDNAMLYKLQANPVGRKYNYTLCLRRGEYIDDSIRKTGYWNDCDPFMRWADKSQGLFVDVGTNIGACSVEMLAHGHRVVSFEPTKPTFAALTAAVQATLASDQRDKRGTIRLINKGASDSPGSSIIYTRPGNSGDSLSPGAKDPTADIKDELEKKKIAGFWDNQKGGLSKPTRPRRNDSYVSSSIELTTIDDEIKEDVDFLKLDAQGHEYKVLLGAKKLLRNFNVRKIMFEWNPSTLFGHKPTAILDLLHEHNYRIYPGYQDHQLKTPIDPAKFKSYAAFRANPTKGDFIAIKNGVENPWDAIARKNAEAEQYQPMRKPLKMTKKAGKKAPLQALRKEIKTETTMSSLKAEPCPTPWEHFKRLFG